MLDNPYDYWRIHEDEMPELDLHTLPVFFEGKIFKDLQIPVGRYYDKGALVYANRNSNCVDYLRVSESLIAQGYLKPYELVGYPLYEDRFVIYRRYVPESMKKYKTVVESIRSGFETMLAKRRVAVIFRIHNMPEDCERIVKEFLLKVPRNRAYH
jgi:hypothetical protein